MYTRIYIYIYIYTHTYIYALGSIHLTTSVESSSDPQESSLECRRPDWLASGGRMRQRAALLRSSHRDPSEGLYELCVYIYIYISIQPAANIQQ